MPTMFKLKSSHLYRAYTLLITVFSSMCIGNTGNEVYMHMPLNFLFIYKELSAYNMNDLLDIRPIRIRSLIWKP